MTIWRSIMWASQTGQFGREEMATLWSAPVPVLIEAVASSSPVVALRCLAEVMLNGDVEKLTALLANPQVNAKWRIWPTDSGLDQRDEWYAEQLTKYRLQLSNRRVGPVEAQLPDLQVLHVQVGDLNYPHYMDADDTNLWVPQYIEPGTRIILRCDQVNRPYFPTASYYEPGTVTSCGKDNVNGYHIIEFRHDPWPPTIYPTYDQYLGIMHKGLTELQTQYDRALAPETPVVITFNLSAENFYAWGAIVACQEVGRLRYLCTVRVLPGQI